MPSSLIFAALAVAWLVVLVPMVARHRQEVRRTADSALAARVLRRGADWPEEVLDMTDDETMQRRYRPGRGGFDPHAADLAARARYALRQRVVFGLLLLALASGLFAGFALPLVWWAHAAVDVTLLVYLGYLRRQVRIEQEVRARRAARAARSSRPSATRPSSDTQQEPERQEPAEPVHRLPQRVVPAGASVVDLDDEDPGFYELDSQAPTPYRRAVGE